jgi:hypothetical protein
MATVAELIGSIRADSPWLVLLAGVLLAGAGAVARRLTGSLGRIGARVGSLERIAASERTRRRQVEQALRDLGVPLPYWPPDGPPPDARPVRARADDEDQADDDATRARPAVNVPPFPEDERARLSRHRR